MWIKDPDPGDTKRPDLDPDPQLVLGRVFSFFELVDKGLIAFKNLFS